MRKLASIQRIKSLDPIEGADRIEVCSFEDVSWQVVVEKGLHQIGDKVVYFEIDSLLPPSDSYAFLEKYHWRVKTIRLRGQLSQGLVMPYSVLPEGSDFEPGDDVTSVMGVQKYEAPVPACLGGKVRGNFPSFLRKTDTERIQNLKFILDEFEGTDWVGCEKLDGSSCTVYWRDGFLGVCSRNLDLTETPDNSFWQLINQLNLPLKLAEYGQNIAIQMELIGNGVQKNPYNIKGITGRVFDVFNIDESRYYDFDDAQSIAFKLGLEWCPLYGRIVLTGLTVEDFLTKAEGKSVLNADAEREGIVWRPVNEKWHRKVGRVAFKAISNRFLLKEKD